MARLPRLVVPGYPHHLTQRGVRSMAVFTSDDDRISYLSFVAEECKRHSVEVLAWCLMTNHVHFIAVPATEQSLARAFGEAHRRYTRMKNFAEGVRGYLFQGRFSSSVLDQSHLLAAVRYVELNPVRAGMAQQAEEYVWSSTRFHLGLVGNDPLVADSNLLGLVPNWEDFLRRDDGGTERLVAAATRTGRPAGDEVFLDKVEAVTGRNMRRKMAGRPKLPALVPVSCV
ncbi:MAG: transposase [Desulfuromonadales bacterium]